MHRSIRILGFVVVALLLARPLPAQSPDLEALVDSIAAEHIEGGRLAGMSVGVVRGAETLLLKAYGHADLEWDVPMPIDAIHEIGSVTKQFTAAAILQLHEQGKIDLDADMTEYLPGFDTQGKAIPVRRLLDHTSGIKGATEIPGFDRLSRLTLPRDSLLTVIQGIPLEFEPGHALIYNNSAYILLGHIIEKVSGQSYEDYVEEHVFPLAGMDDSSYCSNTEVLTKRAHGYAVGRDGLELAEYHDHTWPYSAGSLCSTVADLVAWNRALHGGAVLPPEAYEMMITPRPLEDGTPVRYAMGLSHYVAPSGRVIEHGGGIPGFLTHSRYYPDEDAIVVVLLNTSGPPGPAAVADAIGEHLFGDDHLPEAGAWAGDLESLVGRYRGPARGRTLTTTVSIEDGKLMFSDGGPAREIQPLEGDTFFRGSTRYTFEMEEGRATALRLDHVGGHYLLTAVDEAAEAALRVDVPEDVLESYVGRYELSPTFAIEITREGGQLYGQATDQSRFPLFADSETEFHLEVVEASVEFVREDGAVTALFLHQGGRSQRGARVGR
jgi:CubicO group peptidase (beta-lactamase class C family)